jgi:hypothetical protein
VFIGDSRPNAVPIVFAGELLATGRPGIIGQRMDAGNDALTILLLGQAVLPPNGPRISG